MSPPHEVLIPADRLLRWWANFEERHGATTYDVLDGGLRGTAVDGSSATARLPFDQEYAGPADPSGLLSAVDIPALWGVLLVRKGGFAVATLHGSRIVESKVGQRHVQGRTKAGGQSQQRFARRRDNQARQAYEAAADHAARVLAPRLTALVTGGDRPAVDAVLEDPRLARARDRVVAPWLSVPDPRRAVLDGAVGDACAVRIRVTNA